MTNRVRATVAVTFIVILVFIGAFVVNARGVERICDPRPPDYPGCSVHQVRELEATTGALPTTATTRTGGDRAAIRGIG
jgi:hypothetical protein